MQYHNPILAGMFPDPSVTRVGADYYLANSTFQYYPGIAVSHSRDLVNWERLDGAITATTQADLANARDNEGIFAVNLRNHHGELYAITTNFAEFKTFILHGTIQADHKIAWEPRRVVVDVPGIDPDLYFEGERTFVQFTGYVDDHGTKAIRQVEIDLGTGEILTGPKVLTYGSGGRDVEGPHIIKHNGWYYLLTAEGGTGAGHMITMFRSRELWGPYTGCPDNPLFTNRDRASQPLQNIGHGDLFQDGHGNWWLMCLGTQPVAANFQQYTITGRSTLLYPVNWEGDWPQIYTGVPTAEVDLQDWSKHAQTLASQRGQAWQAALSATRLDPEWVSLRTAPAVTLAATALTVRGGADALAAETGHPGFLGVRLTAATQQFAVTVAPTSRVNRGRVGVAVYQDHAHYVALMLAANPAGGYDVYREQQAFDLHLDDCVGHLETLPDQGTIAVTPATVTLKLGAVAVATATQHFSNEASLAWNTGVVLGLYATEDAQLVITDARRR